jgi:hypothetical protein
VVQSQQFMAARAHIASAMVNRLRSPPLSPRIHSFPTGYIVLVLNYECVKNIVRESRNTGKREEEGGERRK